MAISTTYDPGKMDRRVLLQVYAETVTSNGERTTTWSDYGWRWAEVVSTSANETIEGDRMIVSTATTFRMRWDSVVNEKYRLIYLNRIYNIDGINEVDRRRFMDVVCIAGDMVRPLTADSTYWSADSTTITADMTMY